MIVNEHSRHWIAFLIATLALAFVKTGEPAAPKRLAASADVGTSEGQHHDWIRFGWDAQRSSAPAVDVGITATRIKALTRQQVRLDGTVDASAIYLHGINVKSEVHDVFFVTTTYGKTIAIDADRGTILGIHALDISAVGWDVPHHHRDARGRPRPAVPLRRIAGRNDPKACDQRRTCGLAYLDHPSADA
jgi:hypothetical protein